MTHLYRLDASAGDIAAAFDADAGSDPWVQGYVAPERFAPVVIDGRHRRIVPRLWGVAPPPRGDRRVTHVRNAESPFWIGTLRHPQLRCLIPATRFQLWSGEAGAKRQHCFAVPSQPLFAVAGVLRDDGEVPGFAMMTSPPNDLIADLSPATMPLILHPEDHEDWLSADWHRAQQLIEPYPDQFMSVETGPLKP